MNDNDKMQRERQPIVVVILRGIALIWVCAITVLILIAWTEAINTGQLFTCLMDKDMGGVPVYWCIINTCIFIAGWLITIFASLCLFTLVFKLYYYIVCAELDSTREFLVYPNRHSLVYKVLGLYSAIFILTELVGIIVSIVALLSSAMNEGSGLLAGILILVGPLLLGAFAVVFVVTVAFCVGVLLLVQYAVRMLNYIFTPMI